MSPPIVSVLMRPSERAPANLMIAAICDNKQCSTHKISPTKDLHRSQVDEGFSCTVLLKWKIQTGTMIER